MIICKNKLAIIRSTIGIDTFNDTNKYTYAYLEIVLS